VLFSAYALGDLARIGRSPLFAATFVVAGILGAWDSFSNEAAVAMARPLQIVVRALGLSVVMLGFIAAWVAFGLPRRSEFIFSAWALGELAACVLLAVQLGLRGPARVGRMIATARARAVAGKGVRNHAL